MNARDAIFVEGKADFHFAGGQMLESKLVEMNQDTRPSNPARWGMLVLLR